MRDTRPGCWEIPVERITTLLWCRATDPVGWRGIWERFIRAAGWARYILVTGWLISQWTTIGVSGAPVTTCVYGTVYGTVQIVVRGEFCAAQREIDLG